MKPKTKLQKKIVKLSAKVNPVSEEDKQWASDALFDGYYVRCRKRNYCLECGHKWKPRGSYLAARLLKPTCPECGAERLNHVDGWEVDESVYEYWAIIDVVEGFQLVRMIMAKKYMKRKQPAEYSHKEVMQHWVREDGKITSLTAGTNSFGFHNYVDTWSSTISLEPRTPSQNHKIRCNISPYKIRPGRNTLPIIRRNGYKGYFKGETPHHFFSAILKYPKAETLLKAGQISLFKKCVGMEEDTHEDIEKYWDSICIAIRNDYIVEDAGDWLDYLGMLERFDKDLHNAHYVCPDNLKEEHDRYNRKINEIRAQRRLEEKKEYIEEENQDYVEAKRPFFDLQFNAGDIEIVPLKSVEEFLVEGKKLNHCLYNSDYHKKEDSLILSARKGGEPVETVEVDLQKMEVTQARGLQNQPSEYHDLVVNTVRENLHKIASIVSKNNIAEFESELERSEVAA